ncbi:chromate transporter [Roseomonas sp. SSH11]|uniref:Chromate transporter n=1 Tax=Pararoseomonas baculiformis TaxID=2820812 RepID=A0ABS4A8B3_9PROT|nr:chromate transporter [Pararoseomonas baculiformis]MBP0443238.1 chromate transporter [Pararoseomonas baculiformis]
MNPLAGDIFFFFLKLSLLAVGGANAAVPEMHREVVELRGWMTDASFSQGYALASAAPGPNVLFVAVIGYHVAGWQGLVASLLGFLGPTFILAWGVATLTQRLAGDWRLAALRAGLVPVAIGLILATGLVTGAAAARGSGIEVAVAVLITLASALFTWRSNHTPLWALGAGGVLGLLLLR